jgi:hypothetical protein
MVACLSATAATDPERKMAAESGEKSYLGEARRA